MIGDAAKLIDSLGRNAGTFLPMIANSLSGNRTNAPTQQPINAPTNHNGKGATAPNNGNGNASNLSEMFAKIPKTENK